MVSQACRSDYANGVGPLRVLLVADDPNEALWLEDLLAKAVIPAKISRAPTLADGLAVVADASIDAVLFSLRCAGVNWTKTCGGVARASGHGPIAVLEANDVLDPSEAIAGRVGSAFYKEQITPESINRILLLTAGCRQRRSSQGYPEDSTPFRHHASETNLTAR